MKKILTLWAFAALVSSCKKNDDNSGAALAITKDNIAGTYRVTGESTSVGGSAGTDTYMSSYDVCERDDTYAFTAAGAFTFTDDGTKCSPPNSTFTTTYTLSGNQITMMGSTETIESLTATTLRISYSYTSSGATIKVITTYTRQ